MYVTNPSILKTNIIKCNYTLGNYLISRSIPLLYRKGDFLYFMYGDILKEIIETLPQTLRKEEYTIE